MQGGGGGGHAHSELFCIAWSQSGEDEEDGKHSQQKESRNFSRRSVGLHREPAPSLGLGLRLHVTANSQILEGRLFLP